MRETTQLAIELADILAQHVPKRYIEPAVQAVVAVLATTKLDEHPVDGVVEVVLTALAGPIPEPYRTIILQLEELVPTVRKWWDNRVIEAPEIVVKDLRS